MSDDPIAGAMEGLIGRHPEAAGTLNEVSRERLRAVFLHPQGPEWMEPAGLLDSDSCGYPVGGGFYDVKSDLAALPAAADPAVQERVLNRLVQEWGDDFVLTGRARLDRPWQTYVQDVTGSGD